MKYKSITYKTIEGLTWLLSSSGIQAILQLLVTSVLARLLIPEEFGLVAAAMTVIVFTEMLYELGVGPALVQKEIITDSHINSAFAFTVILGLSISILFIIVNQHIADFFSMPRLKEILDILVWIFPIKSISQISYCLLQREMNFKKIAGLDIISYFIGFGVFGLTLAYFDYGVYALVWANFIQVSIYSFLLLWKSHYKLSFQFSFKDIKELLSYGMGLTVSQIFNLIARKIDYVIIAKLMNPTSLGIYSKAYALMNAPNTVAGKVISKVMFISYAKVQNSEKKKASGLTKTFSLLLIVTVVISAYSITMANDIVNVLLGDQWTEAVIPFQILVAFMFSRVGYKIGGTYLKSISKLKQLSYSQLAYCIYVILGSYFGANFGIIGVSIGVSIAIFLNFITLNILILLNSNVRSSFMLLEFFRSSLIGILVYFVFNNLSLLLHKYLDYSIFVLAITALILISSFALIMWKIPFILGKDFIWFRQQISFILKKKN